MKTFMQCAVALIGAMSLGACVDRDHYIVAATATTVGIHVGQQATSGGSPDATFGYKRAELAVVPTNRGSCTVQNGTTNCVAAAGTGAKDTGEVLMELRYGGGTTVNSISDQSIYQRLAVGASAVSQPGASLMFAKKPDGTIDQAALTAVKSIPEVKLDAERAKEPLVKAYSAAKAANDAKVLGNLDAAAAKANFPNFVAFVRGTPSVADVGVVQKTFDNLQAAN